MHPSTLLLILLPLCTSVRAQIPDSLVLPAATVTAFGAKNRDQLPAASLLIPREELRRYDRSSLLPGLNVMPGVRFEERATASYRIAIRGASLRAPFGVRNTQVYWNGIPYGEPGGDVPLNFLDASNIDRVEVLRGPSGGFYGPGTAGTILLNTDIDEGAVPIAIGSAEKVGIGASLTGGSYGYLRGDLNLTGKNADKQLRLGYQQIDGYRDHSDMNRFTAQYSQTLNPGRTTTKFHALYTDLSYQLPGGLNADQYAENPRQARPGSADKNASINYHNLLLGLTDERYYGRWKFETALYTSGFYFDHPFNFDYKRETNLAAGGRIAARRLLTDELDLTFGLENRRQLRFANNFENPDGTRPGDLNFSDEIISNEALLFSQLRYQPGAWDVTLGLSSSRLAYDIDRTFSVNDDRGETNFVTDRPLSVRLAVGRSIGDLHYLYASRTDGFSPPTLDEFRTNEGSINTGLRPEVGTNYEIGYRISYRGFSANATAFHFRLQEAITTFSDERGTQLFRNAGKTTQNGLELLAQYATSFGRNKYQLNLLGSYTYYDFTYDELRRGDSDFSGQTIPGAAPHTTNLQVVLRYDQRLEISVLHNYVDAIPLNDANDVFADAFHLVRVSVSYDFGKLTVFMSGANLLDQKMSFGNDLNPQFGGRYFQPAAGRTWQVGVTVLGL
ncbi:TonB-dependent receptor domain-containing protein [Neolewinella antarctica]|uniref:Iron complex outermembrane receptor protein n=1 Tax=Neolewinella antarctica TaxID=442734 RepID=A0ABX0X6A6_9BACT|nr:TonB-dependent receptor [Neolewinella antarctica]NJC24529.1 iron complex outermembrane receptor protein [Neolewinella antarctica]